MNGDVDLSVDTWLKNTNYTERRKKNLKDIYNRINDNFDIYNFRRISRVLAFNKHEPYNKPKYARQIYARVDEFKTIFGPITKCIERVLFKDPHFIKYVPVLDRPAYIDSRLRGRPFYYATDYTCFEASFVKEIMEVLDCELFHHMTQNLPSFSLHKSCMEVLLGRNRILFRNKFKFYVDACRMSGEMNTSLCNGFANLMIFLFLADEKGVAADCVVEGDDLLGYMDSPDLTESDYERLGFNCKIERHLNLHSASFCGLVFDPGELLNISDPTKILLKTFYTFPRYRCSNRKQCFRLLRAKAYSILSSFPGCPIVTSFARMLLRWTKHVYPNMRAISRYQKRWIDFSIKDREIGINTRYLMESVFGYTIGEQMQLEKFFNDLDYVPVIYCPILMDHCTLFLKETYFNYVRNVPMNCTVLRDGAI